MSDAESKTNWRNRLFLHGTQPDRAQRILDEGFQTRWEPLEESERADGVTRVVDAPNGDCLGMGAYMTASPRWAAYFGPAILRVEMVPGTRILDISSRPDPKILKRLRQEFGKQILDSTSPWKSMPRNKRFTLPELVAWVSHHFDKTYGPRAMLRDSEKQMVQWRQHERALHNARSVVQRFGYHGFGDPHTDLGVVVFSPDRLEAVELIACLEPDTPMEAPHVQSVAALRAWWAKNATHR